MPATTDAPARVPSAIPKMAPGDHPSSTPAAATLSRVQAFPTPNPTNTQWVEDRLEAIVALYNVTEAGAVLLQSLDLRQMRGEPGFFGSYGFKSWAGVGEAKPISVMHELGTPELLFVGLSQKCTCPLAGQWQLACSGSGTSEAPLRRITCTASLPFQTVAISSS